jgi:hypothetical protein
LSDTDHPKTLFYVGILLVVALVIAAWKLGWFSTIDRAMKNVSPTRNAPMDSDD